MQSIIARKKHGVGPVKLDKKVGDFFIHDRLFSFQLDKVVTLTIKMVNGNLFFRYLSFHRTGLTQKKEQ